jgi:hypothetical protein
MEKQMIQEHFQDNFQPFFYRYLPEMVKAGRDEMKALCPFHKESSPSFNMNCTTGVFYCHGCEASGDIFTFYAKTHGLDVERDFSKVLAGIAQDFNINEGNGGGGRKQTSRTSTGSTLSTSSSKAALVCRYDYQDQGGALLYQIERLEPKSFRIRRPDGSGWAYNAKGVRIIPYHFPQVLKATEIIVCEGEKDADNVAALGFTTTTNPYGAGKWPDDFGSYFAGKNVVLLPHNDDPGRAHMKKVEANLKGHAASIKWIDLPDLPDKGDVSDFITSSSCREEAIERLAVMIEGAGENTSSTSTGEATSRKTSPSIFPTGATVGITAADLMHKVFPEPRWAIPGILPEGLNLLAGKPKKGKSIFALNIGLSIALGGLALGKIQVEAGAVLYLALEDTQRRLKKRINQMLPYANDWPDGLRLVTEWPRMGSGGIEKLEAEIPTIENLRLVIIDTLGKFRKPVKANANLYADDYETVSQIKELADRAGVCILLIHHLRKAEADDIFDTLSGSLGLTGGTDGNLVLQSTRGNVTLHITGRDVEATEMALELDGRMLSWRLLGERAEVKATSDQQRIYDAIKNAVEPLSPKELASITGISIGCVKNMLAKFLDSGDIQKTTRGRYAHKERDALI